MTIPPSPNQAAEKEIRAAVTQQTEDALKAAPPTIDQLTKHIYVEDVKNVRGCDPFTSY